MESFQEYRARITAVHGGPMGKPQNITYDAQCVEPGMLHLSLTNVAPAHRTTKDPEVDINALEVNTYCWIVVTVGQPLKLETPPEDIVFTPECPPGF